MLISVSGIDGGGKSTQVYMLKEDLERRGHSVVVTKAYDDRAKSTLKHLVHSWADEARMFLFQAMHANQYDETRAALDAGSIVIADRWDESYLAYHSNFGPLAHRDDLRVAMNLLAFRDLVPDVGFFIEIPVTIARARREARGAVEKLENRPDDWYMTIQEAYRSIAVSRGWYMLDGTQPPDFLHADIMRRLAL